MKIGFIGLGIMGKPMAMHMVQGGTDLMVSDLDESKVNELVSMGAVAADYETMGRECDIVACILPNAGIVKDVLFGENGIAQYMKPGSLFVDHSSVTAGDSRECDARLREMEIRFMDAPVSGGEEGAIRGSLAVMAGGSEEDFEIANQEMFRHYDSSALLMGEVGAGSVTKLANQIIVNGNIAILAEAMTFAAKAGVDPDRVFHAIHTGFAGSAAMEDKTPMMIARNFKPGATIRVVHKDIKNVLDTAHQMDCPVPYSAQLFEIMQTMKVMGCFDEDHAALVKYFENLAGVIVESPKK